MFFKELDGSVPLLDWLDELAKENQQAYASCIARIRMLKELGHELRRPHADYVTDGIYELRARKGTVQYRILYFFHGQNIAVLAHGLTKEDALPRADIERATRRKALFEAAPERHTSVKEITPMTKKTSDAMQIIEDLTKKHGLQEEADAAYINAVVAHLIYNARTEAGLSQQELGDMIGSTQPTISRLEDADYDGHSLSILRRIAVALKKRISISLLDDKPEKEAA